MLQDLVAAVSVDGGQDRSRGFQDQSSWDQSWESASLYSPSVLPSLVGVSHGMHLE